MSLDERSIITIPNELLIDLAISEQKNRYKEDVYLLYNPIGYGGVLTVGKKIVDLIKLFDGTRDIKTAIRDAGFNCEESETAKRIIEALVEKQML